MSTKLLVLLGQHADESAPAKLAHQALLRSANGVAFNRIVLPKERVLATYTARRDINRAARPALAQNLDAMLERLICYRGEAVALHSIKTNHSLVIIFTDEQEAEFFGGLIAEFEGGPSATLD